MGALMDTDTKPIGYAILVHDPKPEPVDYIVGPFETQEEATSYAAGTQSVIGDDGATTVLVLWSPYIVDRQKV